MWKTAFNRAMKVDKTLASQKKTSQTRIAKTPLAAHRVSSAQSTVDGAVPRASTPAVFNPRRSFPREDNRCMSSENCEKLSKAGYFCAEFQTLILKGLSEGFSAVSENPRSAKPACGPPENLLFPFFPYSPLSFAPSFFPSLSVTSCSKTRVGGKPSRDTRRYTRYSEI